MPSRHKKTDKKEISGKKDNKDQLIIISVIIALVAIGGFAFLIIRAGGNNQTDNKNTSEIRTYNGFIFEKREEGWATNIRLESALNGAARDYEILFHYTPDEVDDIKVLKDSKNNSVAPYLIMNSKLVYITTDPEYPAAVILGGVEIGKILGKIFEIPVKAAVNRPSSNTAAPVITCSDINATQRVIELRLSNDTKISSNNGCIVVEGKNETELLKASDNLAYEILKII